jgi:hypothetical protein
MEPRRRLLEAVDDEMFTLTVPLKAVYPMKSHRLWVPYSQTMLFINRVLDQFRQKTGKEN